METHYAEKQDVQRITIIWDRSKRLEREEDMTRNDWKEMQMSWNKVERMYWSIGG